MEQIVAHGIVWTIVLGVLALDLRFLANVLRSRFRSHRISFGSLIFSKLGSYAAACGAAVIPANG